MGRDAAAPELDTPEPRTTGRSWDDALPECGQETTEVKQVDPPTVLLILDRSSSMQGGPWEATQAAVKQVLEAYAPRTRFGLLMFPQGHYSMPAGEPPDLTTQQLACTMEPVPDVPFGLDQATAIVESMAQAGLSASTPTAGALQAGFGVFSADTAPGPRIAILATDGDPTCGTDCSTCTAPADGGCTTGTCGSCLKKQQCQRKLALDAVAPLTNAGVPTYVVGLPGSTAAAEFLSQAATRGGTGSYYETTNLDDLTEALDGILADANSCQVEVSPTPGWSVMRVYLDDTELEEAEAGADGWALGDGHLLTLYGAACAAAAAPGAVLKIVYKCKY
jgi:hypothetical protein